MDKKYLAKEGVVPKLETNTDSAVPTDAEIAALDQPFTQRVARFTPLASAVESKLDRLSSIRSELATIHASALACRWLREPGIQSPAQNADWNEAAQLFSNSTLADFLERHFKGHEAVGANLLVAAWKRARLEWGLRDRDVDKLRKQVQSVPPGISSIVEMADILNKG